jgi:hypothetical protein
MRLIGVGSRVWPGIIRPVVATTSVGAQIIIRLRVAPTRTAEQHHGHASAFEGAHELSAMRNDAQRDHPFIFTKGMDVSHVEADVETEMGKLFERWGG